MTFADILVPYLWVALGFNLAATGSIVQTCRLQPPTKLLHGRFLWAFGAVASVWLAGVLWPVLLYLKIGAALQQYYPALEPETDDDEE